MDGMLDSNLKSGKKGKGYYSWNKSKDILAIPNYMHILRHVFRSKAYDEPNEHTKSIHNADRVVIVHSHFAVKCLEGKCNSYSVEPEIAELQHYRDTCQPTIDGKECYKKYKRYTVKDTTIWRYKKLLIDRVSTSLVNFGVLDPMEVQ